VNANSAANSSSDKRSTGDIVTGLTLCVAARQSGNKRDNSDIRLDENLSDGCGGSWKRADVESDSEVTMRERSMV
jgi:hypothetical protein